MANLKYIEFPDKVDQYTVSPSDKTIFGAENINSIKEAINNNADVLSEVKSSIPKKLSDLENDLEFDVGILEETDPTVPAWAKASTKPTYTWTEIQEKPTLFSGNYNDLVNKPTIPDIDSLVTESYVDNAISNKADKSELASLVRKIPFSYVNNCVLYSFSDEHLKEAMISSITIMTNDGEVLLPYGTENGISKIYRKSNNFYFQLGSNVESFTEGFIYLSQLILTSTPAGAGLSVDVNSHIEENTTILYGTVMPLDETYLSITMINNAMLSASTSNVRSVEPGNIQNPITLMDCPEGCYIFVLIPSESTLVAYKDDGFGNSINFDENVGIDNSGSTGDLVTVNNKQYKVYGELNLINNSTNIIYIK